MSQIFVIQEHNATHHHYDLRLEIDGVLKRFAIRTKNHLLKYTDFQGENHKGTMAQEQ